MSSSTDSSLPVLAAVLLLLLSVPLLAIVGMAVMMGSMGWMMGGGVAISWWWFLPPFVLVLCIGGLAFVLLARRDPAMETLRTAYARGDLSDEEYEARSERLARRG